ncbi:cobalt-precorrin-6A reductase [Allokutzneria sp. A3M-2-11 16]|uniref:cobalt-precorrin-6A reductase n=1 Tax=Allokutzneria sp. A3M-2-11 16 TaxID=2962043 RepID=UPI0020B7D753|nr:cobalt-precorrin-6A reductase [Allokutzneria sp. A3M-2-11 16]MCP3802536.1 cobalt-precorrin-6A reductase [Allokutzneria sp. A3M-2-11 16]
MTRTVLVLGGTGEARRLAEELRPGLRVISSLAGRVREPKLPVGEVRVGGFGGVEGLAAWLADNHIDAVVDATHPFAATMTASAAEATTRLGLPFLVLRRPGWAEEPGDRWHWVDSIQEAANVVQPLGDRVFLTTGRRDLHAFAELDKFFLVRSVDAPDHQPSRTHVVLDRGPFTVDGEIDLLREHKIDVIVTKDSGSPMTAAKLVAARHLGLPVVVLRRPPLPEGVAEVATVAEAREWLMRDNGEE